MKLEIRVGSVKRGDRGEYIGRESYGKPGSVLRNRWSHDRKSRAEFIVATREKAVACYEVWLRQRIAARDESILRELRRLLKLAKAGPLTIVCWCAPAACHGDVIARILSEAAERDRVCAGGRCSV